MSKDEEQLKTTWTTDYKKKIKKGPVGRPVGRPVGTKKKIASNRVSTTQSKDLDSSSHLAP